MFNILLFVDFATHMFCVCPPLSLLQQSFKHASRSPPLKHGGSNPHLNESGGDDDASPNGNSCDGSCNVELSDSDES